MSRIREGFIFKPLLFSKAAAADKGPDFFSANTFLLKAVDDDEDASVSASPDVVVDLVHVTSCPYVDAFAHALLNTFLSTSSFVNKLNKPKNT
jgi:hypothetical protein